MGHRGEVAVEGGLGGGHQLGIRARGDAVGCADDESQVLGGAGAAVEAAFVEDPLHVAFAQAHHRAAYHHPVEPHLDRHDRGAAEGRRRCERLLLAEGLGEQAGERVPRHRGHHRVRG